MPSLQKRDGESSGSASRLAGSANPVGHAPGSEGSAGEVTILDSTRIAAGRRLPANDSLLPDLPTATGSDKMDVGEVERSGAC